MPVPAAASDARAGFANARVPDTVRMHDRAKLARRPGHPFATGPSGAGHDWAPRVLDLRAAGSSTCWTSSPRAASGAGTRHRAFRRSLTGRSALPLRRS